MNAISTTKAPAAIGPYSQAIKVGNLVYTSGQIPIDPATGVLVEGGIKEQTRQSLNNIKAILEEVGPLGRQETRSRRRIVFQPF